MQGLSYFVQSSSRKYREVRYRPQKVNQIVSLLLLFFDKASVIVLLGNNPEVGERINLDGGRPRSFLANKSQLSKASPCLKGDDPDEDGFSVGHIDLVPLLDDLLDLIFEHYNPKLYFHPSPYKNVEGFFNFKVYLLDLILVVNYNKRLALL